MDSLILYLLKVSAGTMLLYLFHLLFFSMDSFYIRNRLSLLLVLLLPVFLPLLNVVSHPADTGFSQTSVAIYSIMNSENMVDETLSERISSVNANNLLVWIYLSGLIIFIIRDVISITGTINIIRKGRVHQKAFPKIVISGADHPAFSFFPYVVIPEKVFESSKYEDILGHETVHVRQGHTFDLLLCELFIAFQWFNPFVWLIKRSIILNHEYQADNSSIKSLDNKKKYQYTLLNIPANVRTIPLAHNFSGLIKKRLVMINKKPTGNIAAMKTILALPVVAILLLFFSFRTDTGSLNGDNQKITLSQASASEFYKFLSSNILYPQEARNSFDTGRIYVVLRIKKGGFIEEAKAFSDVKDIKVPMMDEVVIVGYKPTSTGIINNNPGNDHIMLKTECLRVAGKIGGLDIPEFKEKDIEFALPFKFVLK